MTRNLRRPAAALALSVGLLAVLATPASATWSLVAVDPATGEVGVAMASCVPADVLGDVADETEPLVPVVLEPGRWAAVLQGQLSLDARTEVLALADTGATPDEILGVITDSDFDSIASVRQYAIFDIDGAIATHTGTDLESAALARTDTDVAVQGNIVVDDAVVTDALARFSESRSAGATLADALVAGLVAGAERGGDRRCGEQTALFAHLAIGDPSADAPISTLTVLVDDGDGQNPVAALATAHRAGRTGLIDAGQGDGGAGGIVRAVAIGAVIVMLFGAGIAMWRGLGSPKARR